MGDEAAVAARAFNGRVTLHPYQRAATLVHLAHGGVSPAAAGALPTITNLLGQIAQLRRVACNRGGPAKRQQDPNEGDDRDYPADNVHQDTPLPRLSLQACSAIVYHMHGHRGMKRLF